MDGHSLRNQSIKENILKGSMIGSLVWLCLVLIETIFRLVKEPLPPPLIILMTVIIYGILGLCTGFFLGLFTSLTLRIAKIKVEQLKIDCFYRAFCIAFSIFLFWVLMFNKQFLDSYASFKFFWGNIGLIIFCSFILVVLYIVFNSIGRKAHILSFFLALTLSVDLSLAGGFYVNTLIPGKFFAFNLINIVANGGIIIGCILLYFLLYFSFKFLSVRISILFHFKTAATILAAILIMGAIIWYIYPGSIPGGPSARVAPGLKVKPNVILITLDTIRTDHISCYGYYRQTTPNLDKFAQESLLFKNAFSTGSWTLPAHASIFTGLYPSKHGAHGKMSAQQYDLGTKLNDQFTTLAEVLQKEGYRTAGVIGGPYCSSNFGLAQGYDYYNENLINIKPDLAHFRLYKIIGKFIPLKDMAFRFGYSGARIAAQMNTIALGWLNRNYTQPFFLFINYFDPHGPFAAPPPYDLLYEGKNEEIIATPEKRGEINYCVREWAFTQSVLSGEMVLSEKKKAHLISQYDGKISYLDFHLGKLLQKLKDLKIYDQTMIVIAGDHGESFGEHNLMFHNVALYGNLLKVPLIIKYPRPMKKKGIAEHTVSLVDIMPEIITTLGLPIPDHIQGIPLGEKKLRGVVAENYRQKAFVKMAPRRFDRDLRAIIKDDFKYIWSSNGKNELYNLQKDPHELHNLVNELPQKGKEMEGFLNRWFPSDEDMPVEEKLKMDKRVLENLKALGYVE